MPCGDCKDSCCSCVKCAEDIKAWHNELPSLKKPSNAAKQIPTYKLILGAIYRASPDPRLDFANKTFQGDTRDFKQSVQKNDPNIPVIENYARALDVAAVARFVEDMDEAGNKCSSSTACCTDACLPGLEVCCCQSFLPGIGCPFPLANYTDCYIVTAFCRVPVNLAFVLPLQTACELPASCFKVCGIRGVQNNRETAEPGACCNGTGCTCALCCTVFNCEEITCKPCSPCCCCGTCWPHTATFCCASIEALAKLATKPTSCVVSYAKSHPILGALACFGAAAVIPATAIGTLWTAATCCGPTTAAASLTAPSALFKIAVASTGYVAVSSSLEYVNHYFARNGIGTDHLGTPITIPSGFKIAVNAIAPLPLVVPPPAMLPAAAVPNVAQPVVQAPLPTIAPPTASLNTDVADAAASAAPPQVALTSPRGGVTTQRGSTTTNRRTTLTNGVGELRSARGDGGGWNLPATFNRNPNASDVKTAAPVVNTQTSGGAATSRTRNSTAGQHLTVAAAASQSGGLSSRGNAYLVGNTVPSNTVITIPVPTVAAIPTNNYTEADFFQDLDAASSLPGIPDTEDTKPDDKSAEAAAPQVVSAANGALANGSSTSTTPVQSLNISGTHSSLSAGATPTLSTGNLVIAFNSPLHSSASAALSAASNITAASIAPPLTPQMNR